MGYFVPLKNKPFAKDGKLVDWAVERRRYKHASETDGKLAMRWEGFNGSRTAMVRTSPMPIFLGEEGTEIDFFHQAHCDQCGKRWVNRIISIFHIDTICLDCKQKEQIHPTNEGARKAEQRAVRCGDWNDPRHCGLPPD